MLRGISPPGCVTLGCVVASAPVAGPLGEARVPRQGMVSLTRPVYGHGPQRCLAACCAPSGLPGAAPPVLMDLYRAGQPTLRRTDPLRMTQAWVVANCMTALRTAVTLAMGAWYPGVARAGTPATNSCHPVGLADFLSFFTCLFSFSVFCGFFLSFCFFVSRSLLMQCLL